MYKSLCRCAHVKSPCTQGRMLVKKENISLSAADDVRNEWSSLHTCTSLCISTAQILLYLSFSECKMFSELQSQSYLLSYWDPEEQVVNEFIKQRSIWWSLTEIVEKLYTSLNSPSRILFAVKKLHIFHTRSVILEPGGLASSFLQDTCGLAIVWRLTFAITLYGLAIACLLPLHSTG
jgi:hypothetical protein